MKSVMDFNIVLNAKKPFNFIRMFQIGQNPRGYKKIKIECCATCWFCLSDPSGCHYCKLCIDFMDFEVGIINFTLVSCFGKCDHYKKEFSDDLL